ncbi:MAG: CoA pyrophosphatase [Sphingopyxis sp.]
MTLAARLRQRLAIAQGDSSVLFDEGLSATVALRPLKQAAVLVAFVDRPHPTLLLTRRQPHLRSHADQVAFPGGGADPADADSIATALREAHEEVGLPANAATIIGTLAPYRTNSGYCITPALVTIPPDLPLIADPAEVAHIFEARCDHVFDPAMLVCKSAMWQGALRNYREVMVDGERVWGVTAGIIHNIGLALGLDADPHALNRDVAA